MLKILLLLIPLFLLTSCLDLPNEAICVTDAPNHAHCAFMVRGADFDVDNVGHNYTQHRRNWDYNHLKLYSLMFPPDAYRTVKDFFINWCHQQKSNSCNADAMAKAYAEFESHVQLKAEYLEDEK